MAQSIAFRRRIRRTHGARSLLKAADGIRRARVHWAWRSDERAFPLQLRTLTIGMRMTLLSPLVAAAALVLARRANVEMGPFGLVFVAAAVIAGLATLLPYERFLPEGLGNGGPVRVVSREPHPDRRRRLGDRRLQLAAHVQVRAYNSALSGRLLASS